MTNLPATQQVAGSASTPLKQGTGAADANSPNVYVGGGSITNTGFNALQGGAANSLLNPFYFSPATGAIFQVTGSSGGALTSGVGTPTADTLRVAAFLYGSHGGLLQSDTSDRLYVDVFGALAGIPSDAQSGFSTVEPTTTVPFAYNGSTYDRARDIPGAIAAGTGDLAFAIAPNAAAAAAPAYSVTGTPAATGVTAKSGAGNLYSYNIVNGATAAVFVAFVDSATPTTTISTTNLRECAGPIAASTGITFHPDVPIGSFLSGISYVATTTVGCLGTAVAPANTLATAILGYR